MCRLRLCHSCPCALQCWHAAALRPIPTFTFTSPCEMQLPAGDGVAEVVLTSGINSFLQLYNAALIARIILT